MRRPVLLGLCVAIVLAGLAAPAPGGAADPTAAGAVLTVEHPASPLYDTRVERIGRAAGCTDADGFFVVSTDALTAALLGTPSLAPTVATLTPAQRRDLVDQLRVMEAEHQMFSDRAARAVAWFDAHGALPPLTPP